MQNQIILDSANTGTFIGPLAGRYASHPELRLRVDELFQAAQRSTNRHFVLEGTTCLAAQSTLQGALHYVNDNTVLVSIQGCGRATHVIGTNGGTMPCGANLKQLDGTLEPYYCALCAA